MLSRILRLFLETRLQETPVFDNDVIDKPSFSDDRLCTKKGRFHHTEKINDNLFANVYDVDAFSYYSILITDNKKNCLGTVEIDYRTNDQFPFARMLTIALKSSARGLGYGKAIYSHFIKEWGGLFSDESLTGGNPSQGTVGSFESWQSLAKSFHMYFLDGTKGIIYPVKNGIQKSMMKNREDRFLATAEPFDYITYNKNSGNNHNEPEEVPTADYGLKKKALTETPQLMYPDAHNGATYDSDPSEWDFTSGKVLANKNVGNGVIFSKSKIQHSQNVKYALKRDGIILAGMRATIEDVEYLIQPGEVKIESVATNPKFRQQGFAKLLYKSVLDLEGIIISDTLLYPGTAYIWEKYLPSIAHMYNLDWNGTLTPFDFTSATGGKRAAYKHFVASIKPLGENSNG